MIWRKFLKTIQNAARDRQTMICFGAGSVHLSITDTHTHTFICKSNWEMFSIKNGHPLEVRKKSQVLERMHRQRENLRWYESQENCVLFWGFLRWEQGNGTDCGILIGTEWFTPLLRRVSSAAPSWRQCAPPGRRSPSPRSCCCCSCSCSWPPSLKAESLADAAPRRPGRRACRRACGSSPRGRHPFAPAGAAPRAGAAWRWPPRGRPPRARPGTAGSPRFRWSVFSTKIEIRLGR